MKKILFLLLAVAFATVASIGSASACTPKHPTPPSSSTYQEKLLSDAPCSQPTADVYLVRKTTGNWFLVEVLPNYANPNYPCQANGAPAPTQTSTVTATQTGPTITYTSVNNVTNVVTVKVIKKVVHHKKHHHHKHHAKKHHKHHPKPRCPKR